MSKNFDLNESLYNNTNNNTDRPPLPPKNRFIRGPPLPPKVNQSKIDIQKESIFKRPNKTKRPSKDLLINNSSYALTTAIIDKPVVSVSMETGAVVTDTKRDVYENYETKEQPTSKRKTNSVLVKMLNFLKISKKYSPVTKSDLLERSSDSKSIIIENNKYNQVHTEQCSNLTICTHCTQLCRTCHSLFQSIHHHYNYHHPIRCQNRFSEHENLKFLPINTSHCCDGRLNLSDLCRSHCSSVLSEKPQDLHVSPIVPNRIRLESPENSTIQVHVEEHETKSIEPPKPSPMEKYSTNFLNKNLLQLKKVGWYWGSVSSSEAERVMTGQPDGTFLVRDSAHTEHLFSVTFRVNLRTYHARIQFSQNRFWWNHNNQDDGFASIIDLIENSMEISRRGEYRYFENTENVSVPPYAVSLLNPLSRFKIVNSLKHLTRFVIISNVRNDHLEQLPLPPNLLSYLYDKEHHYIEDFDRYLNIIDSVKSQSSG